MRMTIIASTIATTLALAACSSNSTTSSTSQAQTMQQNQSDNILMRESTLPYHTPDFDKLTTADYEPAFEKGMAENRAEIEKIANNPASATFENTLVAMEKSGEILNRASTVFFGLSSIISDDEYQRIEAEMGPKLSAHFDNIFLNDKLFARVNTIYKNKDSLSQEDQRLVDYYYNNFVRAGANLSDADKTTMRDINEQVTKLQTEFSQNILASFKNDTILVTEKSKLAGLSDADIASLASAAESADKEGYLITLVNTTRQPILTNLTNRELREKIWKKSSNRALDVNGPIILKLTKLRAQKAKLLGYPNWASYVIEDQMAKTPENVFEILDDLAPKAVARAKQEAADIEEVMHADGLKGDVQPWDWAYYAEKVRKAKYDLDESETKPYFELNSVLENGLFFAMEKLYGITFKERKDIPLYVEDSRVFEVFNADGSSIGLFFFDPYAREGKAGGAWMSEFVTQSFMKQNKPVVYNELNIPKPAEGQPTLLTFDEASTLFHEFGHAAHGLFSQVKYQSLAGTSTARDFVEFPSQFNEDWAIEPAVIANYAKHYKTGEQIPQPLLDKLLKAVQFNKGFDTTEYLAAALLDMEWHTISADANISDVEKFEQKALAKHGIDYAPVKPRYKSSYFSHTFAGGYSAGYYAYLWTEVFAADAFAYMQENGGLTRENGEVFRREVLSKGNSEDLMENYIQFRGQKPTVDALLKRRGLTQ
ncbi:M3 family metallopeptidase [Alteromonas pelagimontana]|uniref:M3 family metallopeptidase n=1 Tax=Alteromonas pelagimontana TaxID=1858656 RepID=A0A6M4MDP2_9ALTE|nr:M3 family metallopeptidase [Alteromonas pelagimontana]QJR80705.1 M3 family metallopeptidase [Alteromonas pelagimontana]